MKWLEDWLGLHGDKSHIETNTSFIKPYEKVFDFKVDETGQGFSSAET